MTTSTTSPPIVLKRDGHKASFDKERIYNAIRLAAEATEELGLPEVRRLTETILLFVGKMAKTRQEISVEELQDMMEQHGASECRLMIGGWVMPTDHLPYTAYAIHRVRREVTRRFS